jgi:hypothetical protein
MNKDDESILDMMDRMATEAIEHADAVLILVSGPSADKEGGTCFYRMQRGNLHANEGLAHEYLRRVRAYADGYHGEEGRRDAVRNSDGFE